MAPEALGAKVVAAFLANLLTSLSRFTCVPGDDSAGK